MRPGAAPHRLDGYLGSALRVSGGQAGQVGQARGAIDIGDGVEQGRRVRRGPQDRLSGRGFHRVLDCGLQRGRTARAQQIGTCLLQCLPGHGMSAGN